MSWSIASNRYKISGPPLGEGYWSTVYPAIDTVLDREVAIKPIQPSGLAQKQMKARGLTLVDVIRREAAASLHNCKHVVFTYLDMDQEDRMFIVMPRHNRKDLAREDALDEAGERRYFGRGLNVDRFVRYALHPAYGLAELHGEVGVTYNDFKPANMLEKDDGSAVLSDLGASSDIAFDPDAPNRDNMGGIFYRAPECFRPGSHPTARSNVFSYGAYLVRLLTGSTPLEGRVTDNQGRATPEEQAELLASYDNKKAWNRDMEAVIRDVPKPFRRLLRRCLYHEDDRYEDATSMLPEAERAIRHYTAEGRRDRIIGRIKKVGYAAAAAAILAIGSLTYAARTMNAELGEQLQDSHAQTEMEAKMRVILNDYGNKKGMPYDDFLQMGPLGFYTSRIPDQRTAYAAYMNRELVMQAIARAGGSTHWDSLEPWLAERDWHLVHTIKNEVGGSCVDNLAMRIRGDLFHQEEAEWNRLERENGVHVPTPLERDSQ